VRRPGPRKLALLACFVAFAGLGGVTGARQRVDAALARGDLERARAIQDRLAWLRLDAAEQRFALARAFAAARQLDAAAPQYERALALAPDGEQWATLAAVHVERGDAEAAVGAWQRGFETNGDPSYLHRASRLLLERGQPERAFAQVERALSLDPASAPIHTRIADTALAMGLPEREIEHLRAAIALEPGSRGLRERLAWRLATRERAEASQREEALRLAEALVEETARRDAHALDTLAAALAAAGRYDDAVLVAAEADDLASRRDQRELAAAIRERLALYRAGRAWIESVGAAKS